MLPCAFLRVFRPLDTFPEPERGMWERYIVAGTAPRRRAIYREESTDPRGPVGLLAQTGADHAEVRLIDRQYFVCPWRTRLRVLASILSYRESAPEDLAEAFVPDLEARRAARELARLKRREPSAVPSMLQSPWHVPIRWFVLVDDAERRVVATAEGRHRLYYWTPVGEARRRLERALHALRRSDLDALAVPVRELAHWLGAFHPRSAVELDYASISPLFSWDELDNDHSAQEVQRAISVLARRGAVGEAAEAYQAVATRWAEVRSRELLN